MKNRRYESSQISRCDSKSSRSYIKNQMMMWWDKNQLIDQMIKSSDFLFFFEKTHQLYHVMIISSYHLNFYHCIASFIFQHICVNRSISKKSTLVMIVIIFVSNSFFDKVQSDAQSKIKNVVVIIVKMCIICEKNITRRASIVNNSISNEIVINNSTKKKRSKQQT